MKIELFFQPASFYSQKARLALEEKGIKYKETFVLLPFNDQNQPWFLKINPNGEVPALKVGDQCYNESEKIIDIVDSLPSDSKDKLVPDPQTPEGKLVKEWRQKLDNIPVPIITYGVMLHPELSSTGLEDAVSALAKSKEDTRKHFTATIKQLEAEKLKHPEHTESYDSKIGKLKERLITFFDKENCMRTLDQTENFMFEIEQQLDKMASEHTGSIWLCGKTLTIADITLCVLLGRFSMLGLLPRYADPQKYPNVAAYWQRAKAKPTVQKVVINNMKETAQCCKARAYRRMGGIVCGVGVAILGVWLAHRYIRK